MRAAATILVIVTGLMLAGGLDREPGIADIEPEHVAPLAESRFAVRATPGRLTLTGTTLSTSHEAALQTLARNRFGTRVTVTEFRPGVLIPDSWAEMSIAVLEVVATMNSAEAILAPLSIDIRGVTSDAVLTASGIDLLHTLVPGNLKLTTDIIVVRSSAPLDELCRKAFSALLLGPVSFEESSAEIRKGSLATLDRVTEFARDCPGVTIAITGHTDSSGDDSWNRVLSRARAQAVADYIASNGIEADRLIVAGAGAAEPIADNSTAYGRQLNRRIEFELR